MSWPPTSNGLFPANISYKSTPSAHQSTEKPTREQQMGKCQWTQHQQTWLLNTAEFYVNESKAEFPTVSYIHAQYLSCWFVLVFLIYKHWLSGSALVSETFGWIRIPVWKVLSSGVLKTNECSRLIRFAKASKTKAKMLTGLTLPYEKQDKN